MLLILDEVDLLLRKDGGDLLYQLLRIDEGRDESGTLSLILVSQEQVLEKLEAAIISRFGRTNHLRLEPYNESQLTEIVTQRASLSTRTGTVSEQILTHIGNLATLGRKFNSLAFASIFSLRPLVIRLDTFSGSILLSLQNSKTASMCVISFSFAIFSISSEKTLGVCKSIIITPLYVWGFLGPHNIISYYISAQA